MLALDAVRQSRILLQRIERVGEDWPRVEITTCDCTRIYSEWLDAERTAI
jgi:hypothetical protein